MIIGSYLLVATMAIYRTNTLILHRDQGKAWVKEYIRAQHK
ncbi:MAG TPA: heme ABC transporter permease, partial [Psychrobacter sp.]|nr:heme ABC transporter permease [Psychrobacter sp.]